MEKEFCKAVEDRRTVYGIGKEKILSDDEIVALVERAAKNAPTAFNSQGGRIAILFGGEHEKLWDETLKILQKIVPPEQFPSTEAKINSFRGGYGTVLFFEDWKTVTDLQQKFDLYKDNFPVWALESSGMLQFIVWTALEDAGYGASLQHYNPLIDETVASAWNLPKEWRLLGQMPFGNPTAAPDPKQFLPVEDRVKVFR